MKAKIALLVGALALITSACGGAGSQTSGAGGSQPAQKPESKPAESQVATVKVAVIAPLSGAFAASGQDILNGNKLASEEINQSGGIKSLGGAKIEMLVGDAGDSAEKTTAIVRQLLANKPAAATGAWYSSLSLAGSQVAEQMKIPWVTGSYSDQIVERGFQYTYQMVAGSKVHSEGLKLVLQQFFKQPDRPIRLAVAKDTNVASADNYKAIQKYAQEKLVDIVVTETWTPPLSDATPIATSILAGKPDVILINGTSTTDSALIIRQLAAQGNKVPVLGLAASSDNPSFLETLGAKALEGMMVPIQGFPGKGSEQVNEAFVKMTGKAFMDAEALTGYTNMYLIARAIEAAKSADPVEVQKALKSLHLVNDPVMSLLPGGTDMKFGSNGRRVGATSMITQWQNGRPMVIYPPELANSKAITGK